LSLNAHGHHTLNNFLDPPLKAQHCFLRISDTADTKTLIVVVNVIDVSKGPLRHTN